MLSKALNLLKTHYGYDSFRKGQENIIRSILNEKDTFAIMPTGAGKSICYQIPACLLEGVTLVISPLISLMKDQVDSLNSIGIKATFINSSLSYEEVRTRIDRAKNGEFKLLYIAPERLKSEDFYELLNDLTIPLVAVDEAHCVSQWGHDFRPSYASIPSLIKNLKKRPIVTAFTATATEEVKEDVIDVLNLKNPNLFVTGFNRENLYFKVFKGEDKEAYIENYVKRNKGKTGIIYAATRKEVESVYKGLLSKGYKVGKYHAGLTPDERKENQEAFLYDDIEIIVATNAFGMGIDKSNVRYVIHHNITKSMESYYQEAGRAGRDSEPSECILLFSPQDVVIQKFLIEQSVTNPERQKQEFKKLQSMVDYCYTSKCLRKFILEYFGEEDIEDKCNYCSICNDDSELVDITIDAQKILSCVVRVKERFGITIIAQILKGSKNKKVLSWNLDNLSTYGIMKEYTEREIKNIINKLIADNYLCLTEEQYPIVKFTLKGIKVLKQQEKVFQKVPKKKEERQVDTSIFEILREVRKNISKKEGVPPYIIFADSTLKEMCEYLPKDYDSLLDIKGVGETKAEKYGEDFLNAINKYAEENGIELVKVPKKRASKNTSKDKIPSHIKTFEMFKQGISLEEIAREREFSLMTINNHIIKCAEEGLAVDLDMFIPPENEDEILKAVEKVGCEKLRPIKELLPEEVDYLAIKAVLCKHKI